MSLKPSRGGWMVWFVMMALIFGGFAERVIAAPQEKDKKEEKKDDKKDEKKDEMKGLLLKSDRKIEFSTDEGT